MKPSTFRYVKEREGAEILAAGLCRALYGLYLEPVRALDSGPFES